MLPAIFFGTHSGALPQTACHSNTRERNDSIQRLVVHERSCSLLVDLAPKSGSAMILVRMFSAATLGFAQVYFFSLAMRVAIRLITPLVDKALKGWPPAYGREELTTLLVILGAMLFLCMVYLVPPVYLLVWLIGTSPPRSAQGYIIGVLVGLAAYVVSKKVFKGNAFIDYI